MREETREEKKEYLLAKMASENFVFDLLTDEQIQLIVKRIKELVLEKITVVPVHYRKLINQVGNFDGVLHDSAMTKLVNEGKIKRARVTIEGKSELAYYKIN